MKVNWAEYISIKPNCICTYYQPIERKKRYCISKNSLENLKHDKFKGDISDRTRRLIMQKIDWLLLISKEKSFIKHKNGKKLKFKLNFITLTLSSEQVHSDNQIKSVLLNQFLVELKQRWQVKNYIWKAESQKNGNIHFHIITDTFIPWHELRIVWNRIQNKLGYVERFKEKHRKDNPNSTDIHSLYKVKNLRKYFSKYMAKSNDNRPIEGRIWGCSYELSRIKSAKEFIYGEIYEEMEKIRNNKKIKRIEETFYDVFFISIKELVKMGFKKIVEITANTIKEVFGEPPELLKEIKMA